MDFSTNDWKDIKNFWNYGPGYALIDPSEISGVECLKQKQRHLDDSGSIIYFLNWGYPALCIESGKLLDIEEASSLLLFNRIPDLLGGWNFYIAPNIRLTGLDRTAMTISIKVITNI